jgi:hypothetical protein
MLACLPSKFCMYGTSQVCLVIWSLWFIWLNWLVSFNQKPDRPDKPNNGLLTLADVFSILGELNPRRCVDNKRAQC